MTSIRRHARLIMVAMLGACSPAVARHDPAGIAPTTRQATVEELVRVRCDHDGRDVVTTWTGSLYSFVPGERQRKLFSLSGMNVARCVRTAEGWQLLSRELMYYLDPVTGAVTHRWNNPWTGETVPVVHVANAVVQMKLGGGVPMQVAGTQATITIDVPLFYPNRLAHIEALRPYSPDADYQAGEFFSLTADAAAVSESSSISTVPGLVIGWFRISPWLPWMNMGDRQGRLVISARGAKVDNIAALPPLLRDEIERRLPLYRTAPRCWVDAPNETSWSHFAAVFESYRAGARFPLPAPERGNECAAASASR